MKYVYKINETQSEVEIKKYILIKKYYTLKKEAENFLYSNFLLKRDLQKISKNLFFYENDLKKLEKVFKNFRIKGNIKNYLDVGYLVSESKKDTSSKHITDKLAFLNKKEAIIKQQQIIQEKIFNYKDIIKELNKYVRRLKCQ